MAGTINIDARGDFFHGAGAPVYGQYGAAATSHPLASAEALAVLRAGGSAADAAIAAVVVQCVVEPQMTGVGGDCFALVKTPDSPPMALNGSGVAADLSPAILQEQGLTEIPPTSPFSVTVPGAVSAWRQLHRRCGRLPWRGLFQTAINYAENGYPIYPRVAMDWRAHGGRVAEDADARAVFAFPDGAPTAGTLHRQPALAETLRTIADDGGKSFYRGDIARQIVDKLNRLGGPHSLDDFAGYKAQWETPVYGEFRGWRVWECAPNGQGIIALMMLALLQQTPPSVMNADRLARFADIVRYAYAWRDAHLGDVPMDWHRAVTDAVAAFAQTPTPASAAPPPEHTDTVYLSVIDGRGMAVSLINSLFNPFGSGIFVGDCGVLLHNRGMSFSTEAGHPNVIAHRKRPLHTIIPALAEGREGETLSFGVMGGHYQAAGHAWFLSRLLDDCDDLQAALNAPRMFNYPAGVEMEPALERQWGAALREKGYPVTVCAAPLGGGQAILRRGDGLLAAASDVRKDGFAVAF